MRISDLLHVVGSAATVVTHPHSQDRAIRWVHITDLPDPSPYLRGGEFILTNGLWYREPGDVLRFVDAVADAGAPAIGYPLSEGLAPPPELAEACERRGIMLMLFPDIPFRDLAERVMTRLVEERQLARMRASGTAKELGRRIADGEGAAALCEILEREAGARTSLLFRDGRSIGAPLGALDRAAGIWEQMFATSIPRDGVLELSPPGGGRVTAAAVAHRAVDGRPDQVSAALVLDTALSALTENIDTLCWIAANYLPRTAALEHGEERQRGFSELLEDARSGHSDAGELAARLRQLDPLSARTVESRAPVLLITDDSGATSPATLAGAIRTALDDAEVLTGAFDGRSVALVAWAAEATAAAATAATTDDEEIASAVVRRLRAVSASVKLGAATMQIDGGGLARALAQAGHALRIAEHSTEPGWATARQAGSYPLLLGEADPLVLESLRLTTVDPIAEYDDTHGTALVGTLRVFLDHCGSWQRAADELHLHVNSLRYRIGRIEQITGRDLARMSDRVDFFLALETERFSRRAPTGASVSTAP